MNMKINFRREFNKIKKEFEANKQKISETQILELMIKKNNI